MRRRSLIALGLAATAALAACTSESSTAAAPSPSTSIELASQSEQSCATPGATALPGCWRKVLPLGNGGFPPGSGNEVIWKPGKFPLGMPPLRAFGGKLWMTAQRVAYSSADGLRWTQHAKTDWGGRIYSSTAYFNRKLWLFGGLDYDARRFLNDIWSSSDGKTWKKVGSAAWRPRGSATVVPYRGRLWLFGGANHVAPDRSTDGFLNDVWVSDDGVKWTRATAAAPWSPRDNAGVVVFDRQLYLVGGNGQADVWRSTNGAQWTRLTSDAPTRNRHGSGTLVFAGKLWVFGGFIDRSTNAVNDVWFSGNGVTWKRQATHARWAPRSPIATAFRNKIWIYSGKHTGADDNWGGDLWQMTATTAR